MKLVRSVCAVAVVLLTAPSVFAAEFTLGEKYAGEDKPGNKVWERKQTPDKSKVICTAWTDTTKAPAESCVVKYASPSEREMFAVEVKKGKLYQAGQLMDSTPKKMTDSAYYIFVQAPDGKFYASPVDKVGQVHHSTFMGGGPVKTAGEMRVEKGVLKGLNNNSGHYRPSTESTLAALEDLKTAGVDIKKVKVEDITKGATH
jgi:hypothetical protein